MKKNGFTLIEIIAVIGILAMLLLIIVPSINNILSRSRENLNEEQQNEIISAARTWAAEHLELVPDEEGGMKPSQPSVTIGTLKNLGYLEDSTVQDLEQDTEIIDETEICINYGSNQYQYKIDLEGEGCS